MVYIGARSTLVSVHMQHKMGNTSIYTHVNFFCFRDCCKMKLFLHTCVLFVWCYVGGKIGLKSNIKTSLGRLSVHKISAVFAFTPNE